MKVKNTNIKHYAKAPKEKKNILTLAGVLIGILVSAILLFFGLQSFLAVEKYYVLNTNIPAKTQVTPNMLQEVETAKGTAPQNAISKDSVAQGTVFSKIPLKTGDVLSASNTGLGAGENKGIPDTWSVTSFNISIDDAAGGNIQKGDYFDIIGINKDGAKYIINNALAIDMNFSANKSTIDKDGKIVDLGETVQYVIGAPAEDIAKLHHAMASFEKIKIVLAPRSTTYEHRDTSKLSEKFRFEDNTKNIDLYDGTDNSFSPVKRDENGRPIK